MKTLKFLASVTFKDVVSSVLITSGVSVLLYAVYHTTFPKQVSTAAPSKSAKPMHIVTPTIECEWLTQKLISEGGLSSDTRVFLKMEAGVQRSGSFKIRGIGLFCRESVSRLLRSQLSLRREDITLVSSSHANAGLATALSAHTLGVNCLIYVENTHEEEYQQSFSGSNSVLTKQLKKMKAMGAELVFKGTNWNETDAFARKLCESAQFVYVPMFDDPLIFKGHASVVREVIDELPQVDCVVISVGGGGLLSGVCLGLVQCSRQSNVAVVGTNSEASLTFANALKCKRITPVPTEVVDANGLPLGTRQICQKAAFWATVFKERFGNPIECAVVSDVNAMAATKLFAKEQNVLVEPLCGQSIAALLTHPKLFSKFKNIVVVVCGGSMVPPGISYVA